MILTSEQIQVIRRDVESYLANNRKLKPTSLDAETMLQLLDTLDAQEDVITKLGRTVQNLKELTFTLSDIPPDIAQIMKAGIPQLKKIIDSPEFIAKLAEAGYRFDRDVFSQMEMEIKAVENMIALPEPSLSASPPQAQVPEPYVDQEHNVVVDPALAPTVEEMPVSDFVTGETISRADHKKKYIQALPTDETF